MERSSGEERSEEAHSFTCVDSFAKLPFSRPSPVAVKENKAIRLFGIEFASHKDTQDALPTSSTDFDSGSTAEENGRKFECHYCCRNFPTSQALGGHQNAHKRERQNAKRAHLRSALAHTTLYDSAHVYGLLNYRFSSQATSPVYPSSSWSSGRHPYGPPFSTSHCNLPLTSSSLQVPCRVPVGQSSGQLARRRPLPPLPGDVAAPDQQGRRHAFESAAGSVQEHVSLDLHL